MPELPPSLAGSELSAVVFVRDYIQLQFDGPVLTALEYPVVIDGANRWSFGDPGYRDGLCAQIGKEVGKGPVVEERELVLVFVDGARIHVSTQPSDATRAEAAHLRYGADDPLWVW